MPSANQSLLPARTLTKLLCLASSALLLASCGRHNLADLPAPLQVEQPVICEEILEAPKLPDVGPETDAVAAFLADDAALIEAVARIRAGRSCLQDQRQDYAGKGRVGQ